MSEEIEKRDGLREYSCRAELTSDYKTFMSLWEDPQEVCENDGHPEGTRFIVNPRIDNDEDTDWEKYPMGRLIFESDLELDDKEIVLIDDNGFETTKMVRGLRWFFAQYFGLHNALHRMGDTLALGEDPTARWYEKGQPTAKRGIQHKARFRSQYF